MGFHFEFFGPVGTACCTLGLPLVVYGLNFASNLQGCLKLYPFSFPSWLTDLPLLSWEGIGVAYFWFFSHLLLHAVLPARQYPGVVEPQGTRWLYRLNGTLVFFGAGITGAVHRLQQ